MNEIIAEFTDYLLNIKNYSTHTVSAYESDISDFIGFYKKFTAQAPQIHSVSVTMTVPWIGLKTNKLWKFG